MNEQVMQQIKQLVDAAKAGDQKATQQVQQIMQAAQQGDQQAMQLAQVIQQMIQSAKQGAKLAYMRSLNRICNPGEQLVYMKAGGKTTCSCQKKPEVAKAGTQIKKKGGCSKAMNGIKAEMMKDVGQKKPAVKEVNGPDGKTVIVNGHVSRFTSNKPGKDGINDTIYHDWRRGTDSSNKDKDKSNYNKDKALYNKLVSDKKLKSK